MDPVLNIRIGNVSPKYHVLFDENFYTMDNTSKETVPGYWKNLVAEHSEIATQEYFIIAK